MKILIITPAFTPSEFGGVKMQSYYLAKSLVKKGHDITVYTSNACNISKNLDWTGMRIVDGINVEYFKNYATNQYCFQFFFPGIISSLKKNLKKYDIVHIHEVRTLQSLILYYFCRKYDVPYIISPHGSLPQMNSKIFFKKVYDYLIGYKILKCASKIIAITRTEKEYLMKIGIKKENITLIPNGIDFNDYLELPVKGLFRNEYNINNEDDLILFLGRIHKIKGLDLLVTAFAELLKERTNIKLVIAGNDHGYLHKIKVLIKKLNIEDNIIFTDFIWGEKKLSAYIDADVYVLPSIYEIFGVTLLEAFACSTPVIVTDRCGIADIVKIGGYVVEYDSEQLRDAMFKMLSDDELRRRFGEEGRKLVKAEFAWSEIVTKMEEIYEISR